MIFQRRIHATDDELSAYLDGRLDAGVRKRVSGHVDGCAICRQALDGLRVVQTSLRGLRAKAPRSFALREAAARPVRARVAGGLSGAMPLLSGVTAMAMIALFAVVGVDMSGGGSSSSAGTKAQPAAVLEFAPSVGDTGSAAAPAQSLTVTVTAGLLSQKAVGTPPQATPEAVTFTEAAPETARAPAGAGTPSLDDTAFGVENSQRLTVTASGAAFNSPSAPPEATPAPAAGASTDGGGDNEMKLRIAEAALAAAALVSGGSAVAVARRRRAV